MYSIKNHERLSKTLDPTGSKHLCLFCKFTESNTIFSPFSEINRADVKDTEMDATISTIVDGLFSYFVTLGKASPLPLYPCD